jgi:alcohol dehydrogenase class IV
VAQMLTGKSQARPEDALAWLRDLIVELKIPGLSVYGLQVSDLPELAQKAARASSMKANPILLTQPELEQILQDAL